MPQFYRISDRWIPIFEYAKFGGEFVKKNISIHHFKILLWHFMAEITFREVYVL
jgi:hypothetical protein